MGASCALLLLPIAGGVATERSQSSGVGNFNSFGDPQVDLIHIGCAGSRLVLRLVESTAHNVFGDGERELHPVVETIGEARGAGEVTVGNLPETFRAGSRAGSPRSSRPSGTSG